MDEDQGLNLLYEEIDVDSLPGIGEAYAPYVELDDDLDSVASESFVTKSDLAAEREPRQRDRSLSPEALLEKYWGYSQFRPLQREIITSVLDGRDTLGLMPTGGGKSITFQVPALKLTGLTLVITPLISLMKDQVDGLKARRIRAAAINSSMYRERIITTLDNCIYGRYKFLYISPERLASPIFLSRLDALNVSLIVVDECHCISQWGYDFRPAYLNIVEVRNLLPRVPILALTATATHAVADDICHVLRFHDGGVRLTKSFFRPNLSYVVRHTPDKQEQIVHILRSVPGSAVIYCRSRKQTRELAEYLNNEDISADYFHAGLNHTERDLRQNRWMTGEQRVMVATSAFGMGIDKPDVRVVIHQMMPNSIEEYFQEAGRAGRDGQKAYAVTLVSSRDRAILKKRLSDEFPSRDYIHRVYDSVCNFLQVGEGEGFERSFDFDLQLFIRRFRMHPVQSLAAIRILEMAAIWSYQEDETRSRLCFLCRRDELYRLKSRNQAEDVMLGSVMRLYPGLFSDYVFIDEPTIASKSGLTPNEVYLLLVSLDKQGILHYIPRRRIPRILFLTRREDPRYLNIPNSAYQERRDRFAQRIDATIRYITTDHTCRSQLLLGYFGEKGVSPCGSCDVCLQQRSRTRVLEQPSQDIGAVTRYIDEARREGKKIIPIMDIAKVTQLPDNLLCDALLVQINLSNDLSLDGDVLMIKS